MRVSNLSTKDSMIHDLKRNYSELKNVEKQLGSGKRFQKVSEDTVSAITSIYSKIRLSQMDQYYQNIQDSEDRMNIIHDKLTSITQMLQRVREIAVQGGTGTYSPQDRENMAVEVEELLKEVISQSNTIYEDGYIFAGSKTDTKPFEVSYASNVTGQQIIDRVEYQGDIFNHTTDISLDEQINTSLTGNQVFWGDNHIIVSLQDSANYVADRDQKIFIDNYEVLINAGDNLDVVVGKINEQIPSVSAFKRVLPGGETALALESNFPHEMAVLDIEGGSVLEDLGILKPGADGEQFFNNISENTLQSRTSIFDIMIQVRNSLVSDDIQNIGGNNLASIDNAIQNVLTNQTKISSIASRLEIGRHDLDVEKENITIRLSKSEDVDMAEAAINLSEINNIHQLSLQTAARYIRPTLLDFL